MRMFDDGRSIGLHAVPPFAGSIDVRVETRPHAIVDEVYGFASTGSVSNLAGVVKPACAPSLPRIIHKSSSAAANLAACSRSKTGRPAT